VRKLSCTRAHCTTGIGAIAPPAAPRPIQGLNNGLAPLTDIRIHGVRRLATDRTLCIYEGPGFSITERVDVDHTDQITLELPGGRVELRMEEKVISRVSYTPR
jgi:hypothetical protein